MYYRLLFSFSTFPFNIGDVTRHSICQTLVCERVRQIADATQQAMKSDMVVFVGGLNKSDRQDAEGNDRLGFELPYNQDAVIDALSKVNPNLVVVTLTGNAFAMPWVDNVAAIVQGWYIGSESGESLADVLFGDVNPSGKLPITFAKSLADYAPHSYGEEAVYPGQGGDAVTRARLTLQSRFRFQTPAVVLARRWCRLM